MAQALPVIPYLVDPFGSIGHDLAPGIFKYTPGGAIKEATPKPPEVKQPIPPPPGEKPPTPAGPTVTLAAPIPPTPTPVPAAPPPVKRQRPIKTGTGDVGDRTQGLIGGGRSGNDRMLLS